MTMEPQPLEGQQSWTQRLRQSPPFQGLPEDELQLLTTRLEEHRYSPGDIVFHEGTPLSALYLVIRGEVRESAQDEAGQEAFRKTYGPLDCIGGDALLRGQHRGTGRALTDTVLLQLPESDLTRLLAQYPGFDLRLLPKEVAGALRAMPVFGQLSDQAVLDIASLVQKQEVQPQRVILRAGDRDTDLHLISAGQVELRRGGQVQVLTAGNFVGEESVLLERPSSSSARALTAVELHTLPADDFRWLLKIHPELANAFERPDVVGRLGQTSIFSGLTGPQLQHLAGYVRWVHYPRGYVVTTQGDAGTSFYILDRGEAIIRRMDTLGRERPRGHLGAGESFGQTSLFLGDLRDATVAAITGTDWLVLHREDFRLASSASPDLERRLHIRPETKQRLNPPRFTWLRADEIVVEQVRRHPIIAVGRLALPVLIAVALLVLLFIDALPPWLLGLLLGFDLLYGLWSYTDWRNDYLVITSQRLTHQEQVWPVSERRVEAPLRQIQEISIKRGFWGSSLNYGLLRIQTAASVGLIEFTSTPDPMRVKDLILDRVARARASEQAEQRANVRRALHQRLGAGLELSPPARAVLHSQPSTTAPAQRFNWRDIRLLPWLKREDDNSITWRKHWIRLLVRIWRPLLLCVFLTWLAVMVGGGRIGFIPSEPVFWLPWFLVTFASSFWLWWEYADWGNDVYTITTDRIIDIEKKPLFFAEDRREADLGKVQNVSANIPGPLAYLFNFGHVEIYTAAEIGRFDFLFVPNPREVQAEIFRRIERFRVAEAQRAAQQRQAEIADWFETYHQITTPRR